MWVLVCATLVAGALGHYHYYDPRSIIARDPLQNDLEPSRPDLAYSEYGVPQGVDFRVVCPGCKRSSDYNTLRIITNNTHSKRCVGDAPAKKCEHGHYQTYDEYGCPRKNCYKGFRENCTDSNCAPGYTCKLNENYIRTCDTTLEQDYNAGYIPSQFHLQRFRYGAK